MSDFNLISSFKPKVENTFLSKGGGGGNTGYFNQGRKKKDKDDSILGKMLDGDSADKFGNDVPEVEEENILDKVKGFLGRIV